MTGLATMLASGDATQHILPHEIFRVGRFHFEPWSWGPFVLTDYIPFTSHMLMVLITAGLMLVIFPLIGRRYPMVPKGVHAFFDTAFEFVREGVARPALRDHTDRFMPFVWTMFFFILINNLLGIVPLNAIATLIWRRPHLFGTATAGLSVTAGLASITFIAVHAAGILEQIRRQREHGLSALGAAGKGFVAYWYHLVPHVPGVLGVLLFPFLFALELIGALVKPFALAIRLFANMMAGHVVLASLLMLVPILRSYLDWELATVTIVGCAAYCCLELLVALIQAYIFTFLTCMFIGAAVSPEH